MNRALFIATIAAACIDTGGAMGQELCGPRTDLLAALADRYHEAPVALGIENRGALLEVLTSTDGATWTILISDPEGRTCVVATGEEWQSLVRELKDGPEL